MRKVWILSSVIAVSGCGGKAEMADPCPGGICVGTEGQGGKTGGAAGGGRTGAGGAQSEGGAAGGGTTGGEGGTGGGGALGSGGAVGAAGEIGSGGSMGAGGSMGSGGSGTPDAGAPDRPPLGPPAALDFDFYKCNVHRIFARSCGLLGCHGDEARAKPGLFRMYATGRLRNTAEPNPVACGGGVMKSGTVHCTPSPTATEWQRSFDSARQFMTAGLDPEMSEMLRQPTKGGLAHVGVHPFTRGDASYTIVKRWLSSEKLGRVCPTE